MTMNIPTISPRRRTLLKLVAAGLLLAGASPRAGAWGHGGGRGGGRGGVYVGVGFAPLWWPYDPYFYAPGYYYPPAYPYAAPAPDYAGYAPAAAPAQSAQQSPNTRYEIKTFEDQVVKARESVKYEYSDGDISKEQYNAASRNFEATEREAQSEASANGGFLYRAQQDSLMRSLWTGQPPAPVAPPASSEASAPVAPPAAAPQPPAAMPAAPPSSGGAAGGENLRAVTDQIAHLRKLLDNKLAHGDVTKAQRDGEAAYLDRLEKLARGQAADGNLGPDQENALLLQLIHVQKSIQQNFITN
ncbi:MAG: hypothetical protein ACHQ49_09270 [Elusimicrobiota bacterium]